MPYTKYSNRIKGLRIKLALKENKSKRLTWVRSLLFLASIGTLFIYFKQDLSHLFLLVPLILFFIFLRFVGASNQIKQQVKLLLQLIQINQNEIAYHHRKFDAFEEGIEYQDSHHFFAYDLDVFGHNSLFQHINRTSLKEGADKLAHWLTHPLSDKAKITQRQSAIKELQTKLAWRQEFQAIGELDQIGKKILSNNLTLNQPFVRSQYFYFIFILPIITIILITLSILGYISKGLPILMVVIQLIITYLFSMKLKTTDMGLSQFAKHISPYIRLIQLVESQKFESEILAKQHQILLNKSHNSLEAFQQLRKLLNSFEQRFSPIYIIIGNGVFFIDFYLLKKVDSWFEQYGQHIESWIDALAEINALNSLANFYENYPTYVMPTITENALVQSKELGHPLIPVQKNVTNDFSINNLNEIFIVTGANMAGKSTFLRTVGVNILLASVGAPVCASEFTFQPLHLFTSMRTTDNLAEDVSYFHAELLRLKKLVDTVEAHPNEKYVIILDEILKGTNSKDKLIGSVQFLEKLLHYPISGLIATHDLALGELAETYPQNFTNICFEITIANDDVTYDYKLRKGITKNFNATFLLRKMGLIGKRNRN